MHLPILRAAGAVALVTVLVWAPVAAHAQLVGVPAAPSGGEKLIEAGPLFLNGPAPSFGGRYLRSTMALGVPSPMVSALILRGRGVDGLGVRHGALFVVGLREVETSTALLWWNDLASAYSTVRGILQIQSTIGDGPDPSSLRAWINPEANGFQLRVIWKY